MALACAATTLALVVSACSDEGVLSTGPSSLSSGNGGGDNRLKFQSVVTDRSGSCPTIRFNLGGINVETTADTDFEIPCDRVMNGAAIEVDGAGIVGGVLVAREVEQEDEALRETRFEAEGPVASVSSAGDCTDASGRQITVLGLRFAVGDFTRVRDISNGCAGLTVGTRVRVRGVLSNTPSIPMLPLRATELERHD
jgi:hypothetical protein